MNKTVLVTGASGLLGRALVDLLCREGFPVLGQYCRHKPDEKQNYRSLQGDFSTLEGIRAFLTTHRDEITACPYLVNNYGPITYKDIGELTAEDLLYDFHHNLVTAFEITRFMMAHGNLRSVVNLGFEHAGEVRAYRNILSYGAAKNALLLATRSLAARFPDTRFNMICPPSMTGAAVKKKGAPEVPVEQVARQVYDALVG